MFQFNINAKIFISEEEEIERKLEEEWFNDNKYMFENSEKEKKWLNKYAIVIYIINIKKNIYYVQDIYKLI